MLVMAVVVTMKKRKLSSWSTGSHFLAGKAARGEKQEQNDRAVDHSGLVSDRKAQLRGAGNKCRKIEGNNETLHEGDEQRRQDGAVDRADTANQNNAEYWNDVDESEIGIELSVPCDERAAEPREGAAYVPHHRDHLLGVDAASLRKVTVGRGGAHCFADLRILQEEVEGEHGERSDDEDPDLRRCDERAEHS